MFTKTTFRALLWAAPLAALVMASACAAKMASRPADLDYSLIQSTSGGHYRASLEPQKSPIPVGAMHTWTVTVETPAGTPVDAAAISIGGGMPQHGHGLPTRPKVTKNLGNGKYLIEGMKFNMTGWWILSVSIDGPEGAEKATFNLSL
jgi:hypothetical protein